MAEKSAAVTCQPRPASQIALRPSPVPRPAASAAASPVTKRFGPAPPARSGPG
ncbi:MAG TPA: hypothetical protein VF838_10870 [Trebonia sp.]